MGELEQNISVGTRGRSLQKTLDYTVLAREIIVQMRGSLSQRELSEHLGYSFNQVGKWESGSTQIKWKDFIRLSLVKGIPLSDCLSYYFLEKIDKTQLENISIYIQKYLGAILDSGKSSAVLLTKWQQGRFAPSLSDVLVWFDMRSSSLIGFLNLFLKVEDLPSLKREFEYFSKALQIIEHRPSLVFINAALQLREYRDLEGHSEDILTKHSCCSREELRQSLKQMVDLGLVSFDGKKYHPCAFDFSFSNLRLRQVRKFNKYVSLLAGDAYPLYPAQGRKMMADTNPSRSSVRVNAMSKEAALKVDELLCRFHNQVNEIIKNDQKPKNNVQVMVLHSFVSSLASSNNYQKVQKMMGEEILPSSIDLTIMRN